MFDWFTSVGNGLQNITQSIADIPTLIIQSIKDALQWAFVPSDDYFTNKFNDLKISVSSKLNIDFSELDKLHNLSENGLNDINMNFHNQEVKVLDLSFFNNYKNTIKSWINGFIAILLLLYNVDMTYFMIRGTHILTTEGWRSKE